MKEPADVERIRAIYEATTEVVTPSGERHARPAHLLFERSDVKCLLDEVARLRRGVMGAAMFAKPAADVVQPGASMSLNGARRLNRCRICGNPATSPLELHFGAEYAHTACLYPDAARPRPEPPTAVVIENGKEPRKDQT